MNRIIELLRSAHALLVKGASQLQSPLLLVVRLYWGWAFFQTGKGKLMNLDQTTEFFSGLGIPMPGVNAVMAAATECFGGLLLLLGLASRPAAALLSFTMIVAYLTADLDAVKGIFSDPDAFLEAAPFQFLFASVLVLVFGPGFFSLDRILQWWSDRKQAPRAATPALQASLR
ncbi:DoxX family protein [Verrucomicrobiaceae bacterium SCGC AG-212-N21]|nr:DoxX family protein [Verrucomicrobiaceae bacterium SCGC AG-212-N21]